MIHLGDCLKVLKTLSDNSVDSVVTDPPAGISFMGKDWDDDKGGRDNWIAWLTEVLKECNRVLKPGGHALVWSIPRTSHWTGMACENAGFEVRDQISHIFGSGFPKSLNVSKAIDKEAGIEREVIGADPEAARRNKTVSKFASTYGEIKDAIDCPITAPATDLAKQWDGWGTALKPSREDWWLCRKLLSESTVAKNVVKWSTGALNIDDSRIELVGDRRSPCASDGTVHRTNKNSYGEHKNSESFDLTKGRWPSHTIFDEEAAALLDEQVKETMPGMHGAGSAIERWDETKPHEGVEFLKSQGALRKQTRHGDTGGASRFFYVAKASKRERGENNHHPTVKSIKLMEYLIKLVTPPNGTVLDPFMGSGSTGVAAKNLGMQFIGIEQNEEYFEIAKKRIG